MCAYPVTETDLEDGSILLCELCAVSGMMLPKQEQTTEYRHAWQLWQTLDLRDVCTAKQDVYTVQQYGYHRAGNDEGRHFTEAPEILKATKGAT